MRRISPPPSFLYISYYHLCAFQLNTGLPLTLSLPAACPSSKELTVNADRKVKGMTVVRLGTLPAGANMYSRYLREMCGMYEVTNLAVVSLF